MGQMTVSCIQGGEGQVEFALISVFLSEAGLVYTFFPTWSV